MEKIISEREHIIPINRVIRLLKEKGQIDISYVTRAKITNPKGYDGQAFLVSSKDSYPCVTIPKTPNGRRLQTNTVILKVWQDVAKSVDIPKTEVKPQIKNPTPPVEEKPKTGIMDKLKGLPIIRDLQDEALKRSEDRDKIIATKRGQVQESVALKPVGLDGLRIMTADDCDYSRGVVIIQNLITALKFHNAGIKEINRKKLLCEYHDVFSFSGASTVIGLHVALGDKAMAKGNLEAFLKWYHIELSKVYSPTSAGELLKKGKKILQGMKPKKMRKSPNPGFSLKNVEKIVGALFTNQNTAEPFRMKDLHCEVYQPMMLDDERSFVYSKEETPEAKLVDVVINTALDPNYFQTRKIEGMGISKGPIRRSFDLPIAQHNENIEIISVGCELTYRESEEELEGVTPAQNSFINKPQNYRVGYEDTKKYMLDHSSKVRYMRIESPQLPEVSENSIAEDDFIRCRVSAKKSKVWTNGQKTALTWS